MKLIGTSKNGRHAAGGKKISSVSKPDADNKNKSLFKKTAEESKMKDGVSKPRKKKMPAKKKAIIIASVLGGILLITVALALVWWYQIQPVYSWIWKKPQVNFDIPFMNHPDIMNDIMNDPDHPLNPDNPNSIQIEEIRNINKYTFLVLGIDGYKNLRTEGGANTDVIMLATFDTDELTLNVVSIPRDTIVNVSWSIKKINSIWANMRYRHNGKSDIDTLAMEDTKKYIADFVGYNVDYWITLDMAGFVQLIDSLPGGGVNVNVPYSVFVEEPGIMKVTLSPGQQTLNGIQALALVRERDKVSDFGRIDAQHILMSAMAEQLLSQGSSINISSLVSIFLNHVNTDMNANTLAWMGREALKLSIENIHFASAPCEILTRTINGTSYVYVHLDEWLEMINEMLNPYEIDITPQLVSILTLNESRRFYVTNDQYQASRNWGN